MWSNSNRGFHLGSVPRVIFFKSTAADSTWVSVSLSLLSTRIPWGWSSGWLEYSLENLHHLLMPSLLERSFVLEWETHSSLGFPHVCLRVMELSALWLAALNARTLTSGTLSDCDHPAWHRSQAGSSCLNLLTFIFPPHHFLFWSHRPPSFLGPHHPSSPSSSSSSVTSFCSLLRFHEQKGSAHYGLWYPHFWFYRIFLLCSSRQ